MEQQLSCPNCKGNKFSIVAEDTYKCAYCGNVFSKPKTETVNPAPAQAPYGQPYGQPGPQPIYVQAPAMQQMQAPQRTKLHDRSRTTAIILAFFLGAVGIHKFYLGQTTAGVVYLLFFWTCIPAFLALIDFIVLLVMDDDKFDDKYNY